MNKTKYSYCLDENKNLIHINNVSVENRHDHTYRCLTCGQEMIAKIGKIKIPHFAHSVDTACDGESYLHKLAKIRIKEEFMSSDSFPITFIRDIPCQEFNQCPCCTDYYCINKDVSILSDLKKWKGKIVYNDCQEEIPIDNFRPDLLLSCKENPQRPFVFIEIYKTHESNEQKISSQYRIIETMRIRSEEDIDDIIYRGFVEGENCKTHNFKPQLPSIRKSDIPITRFVLFGNGGAIVIPAADYKILCDKLNQKFYQHSVIELNMSRSGYDIWELCEANNTLDSYQTGLVYLTKKGMDIRNCILCKFYKFNEWQNTHVCIRYKSLGEEYHFPKQTTAKNCPQYEKNPVLLNHTLSELEKMVSEVESNLLQSTQNEGSR